MNRQFFCIEEHGEIPKGSRRYQEMSGRADGEKEIYYRLVCKEDGKTVICAEVFPRMGFKSAGLCWRGNPLQPFTPDWAEMLLGGGGAGSPVLYPTPNRVRNHTFVFRGEQVEMKKNGEPRGLHGIAMDSEWRVAETGADENSAWVTAVLEIRRGDENYSAFPFESRLTASYVIEKDALLFRYTVENLDTRALPFGLGLHPGFFVPAQPDTMMLRLPAEHVYETEPDLLPTGNLIPTKGDERFDLNEFRDVRSLDLDTVFLADEKHEAWLRYDSYGCQLHITASPEFRHGVVFTGPMRRAGTGMGSVCVETQSCCTDAINLHERGEENTGLLIVDPGEKHSGEICYRMETIS